MSIRTCDLYPACQGQGCEADPARCRRAVAMFKLSIKSAADDNLFAIWDEVHGMRRTDLARIVIAEFNARSVEVIYL